MGGVYEQYEKVKAIGIGAFGRCYLCKRQDASFVVLKKIAFGDDALNEARILSELSHANVVKAVETYRSLNSVYIVLEYLAGGNLDEFIKKHQVPIKPVIVINYICQICNALVYIHSMSVVHRDVKPVNCLLSIDESTIKLADFGISLKLNEGELAVGKRGTSAYMSPEVLDGREYDFKCDMWALGCVLYEIVERRRLFEASSEMAVQYKICMGRFTLSENCRFYPLLRSLLTNSTISRPSSQGGFLYFQYRTEYVKMSDKQISSSSSSIASKIRVGKISVDELLNPPPISPMYGGHNSRFDNSHRYGGGRSGWRTPLFPQGFSSLTQAPDRYSHQNYIQPEILLAAMAAASTAQQALNERRNTSYLQNLALNNSFTCPNCTYSTPTDLLSITGSVNMSPHQHPNHNQSLTSSYKRNSLSPQQFNESIFSADKNRCYSQEFVNNFFGPPPPSPNVFLMQRQIQKTRKPYFMPYISEGAMLRGLKNNDFLKSTLHINRQNYEESYIEQQLNDEAVNDDDDIEQRKKILILSVHDRNRALHGDEVVIRIKDRSEWMIREPLYQSWRAGELNELFDENGQPVSVPPVISVNLNDKIPGSELLEFLPLMFNKRVAFNDMQKPVLLSEKNHYSSETLLRLAAQLEFCRREYGKKNELDEETLSLVKSLAIGRDIFKQKLDANGNHSFSGNNIYSGGRYHVSGHGAQRITYRLLADMPDDDWGIPDICLQKTAEVVYIFKTKNCRAAVGHLKVMADGNRNWALFSPADSRMPRMMVPADQLPAGFFERPYEFSKLLFVAQIVEWPATAQFARGKLVKQVIGTEHDADTEALILAARGESTGFTAEY